MIPDLGFMTNAVLKILPRDFHGIPINKDTLDVVDSLCRSLRD
jgi:hypothetical protein